MPMSTLADIKIYSLGAGPVLTTYIVPPFHIRYGVGKPVLFSLHPMSRPRETFYISCVYAKQMGMLACLHKQNSKEKIRSEI